MNVRLPDDWISAYHDGELTPSEREEADRQLETSPAARAELESYRELSRRIGALPIDAAPGELRHAVMLQTERTLLIPETEAAAVHVPSGLAVRHVRRWQMTGVVTAAGLLIAVTLWTAVDVSRRNSDEKSLSVVAKSELPAANLAVDAHPAESNAIGDASLTGPYMGAISNSMVFDGNEIASDETLSVDVAMRGSESMQPVRGQSLSQAVRRELLQNPQLLGQMFYYFPSNDDQVAVVEMTVVDVRKSAGQLQVLLSQNAVLPEQVRVNDGDSLRAVETSAKDEPDGVSDSSSDVEYGYSEELIAVFVQATPEQLAATVRELDLNADVVNFSLHPPLQANVAQLASGDTQVWKQLDESLMQPSEGETEFTDDSSDVREVREPIATKTSDGVVGDKTNADRIASDSRVAKSQTNRLQNNNGEGDSQPLAMRKSKVQPVEPAKLPSTGVNADFDADVAIALKPGETRNSLGVETVQAARDARAGLSYQMVLPVPAESLLSQRSQKERLRRPIVRSQAKAKYDKATQAATRDSEHVFDDAVTAKKPSFAVLAETQQSSSAEAMSEVESSPALPEVRVLFVFTHPRHAIIPESSGQKKIDRGHRK
ncbi:MAG: hypothetical protein O2955_14635 [Planctomycetota bacterium]|nr:hypothetical protein [Planctomycetota bacterium]MDA1213749.1 hypothetical protein [Planctomycetota bacterium]